MTSQPLNEMDFESPGYEYLRTYQNMSNLYHKLVVLNYQRDFCSIYKCPPIHKYYFSMPNKNQSEQLFLFTCLCAWLIKDKCQMNFDIEPDEYQDIDSTIGVIAEALKLLLTNEEDSYGDSAQVINFPLGRLKQGYGPEVIYMLNIFADRALEMQRDPVASSDQIQIVYHNKTSPPDQRQTNTNYIMIGRPFVGGGLTTRPLGSYQIDDSSLLLDDHDDSENNDCPRKEVSLLDMHIDQADWYRQVDRVRPSLEAANLGEKDDIVVVENWLDYLEATRDYQKCIQDFLDQCKSLLVSISGRIDRQMQVINGREKFIQTNLRVQIEDFLKVWRDYTTQTSRHSELLDKVNSKADLFESHNGRLDSIRAKIETRIRELDDGSKLKELEMITKSLGAESDELSMRVTLLLTVYGKRQARILSEPSWLWATLLARCTPLVRRCSTYTGPKKCCPMGCESINSSFHVTIVVVAIGLGHLIKCYKIRLYRTSKLFGCTLMNLREQARLIGQPTCSSTIRAYF